MLRGERSDILLPGSRCGRESTNPFRSFARRARIESGPVNTARRPALGSAQSASRGSLIAGELWRRHRPTCGEEGMPGNGDFSETFGREKTYRDNSRAREQGEARAGSPPRGPRSCGTFPEWRPTVGRVSPVGGCGKGSATPWVEQPKWDWGESNHRSWKNWNFAPPRLPGVNKV